MSCRVVLFTKKKKLYTPKDVFFRNFSNFSEQLLGDCFRGKITFKKFLEIAVLKYLKLPGNYP